MNTHMHLLLCLLLHVAFCSLHVVLKGAKICSELVSRVLFNGHFWVCVA